jgi:hypothetical protein
VDVVVGANVVDVLLIVEGGLVAVERTAPGGGRRVRQLGEVVVVQAGLSYQSHVKISHHAKSSWKPHDLSFRRGSG